MRSASIGCLQDDVFVILKLGFNHMFDFSFYPIQFTKQLRGFIS